MPTSRTEVKPDLVTILNNILEYSRTGHIIVKAKVLTPTSATRWLKGVSDKKGEFYFPLTAVRSLAGYHYEPLTVLRRIDRHQLVRIRPVDGMPDANVKLIDDLKTSIGKRWRVKIPKELVLDTKA